MSFADDSLSLLQNVAGCLIGSVLAIVITAVSMMCTVTQLVLAAILGKFDAIVVCIKEMAERIFALPRVQHAHRKRDVDKDK